MLPTLVQGKSLPVFFLFKAIEKLNIKPSYWKDLVTDEPFTRNDVIHIQDPTNLDKFNFAQFFHVRKKLKLVDEGGHSSLNFI